MTTPHNAQSPQTCTCGKPNEPGTHRIDGPCYVSANPAPAETATPTPETDGAMFVAFYGNSTRPVVSADFARRLERERDQARQQFCDEQADLVKARQTIYRMCARVQHGEFSDDCPFCLAKTQSPGVPNPMCHLCELESERESLRAKLKSMADQFLAVSGEQSKAVDDAYWRGYRARLDESTTETPEPTNPTLWRYLQNAFEKKITFHVIGVNRRPDGGFHFYIHPQSVSGETEDYLIWPDPFNWSDMLVNRKDSPPPDIEKFKASMRKALAQSDSPGAGVKGETP